MLLDCFEHGSGLLISGFETSDHGLRTMHQGMIEPMGVCTAVKVIHLYILQDADGEFPGFVCCPVIDLQSGAAAANINAALA